MEKVIDWFQYGLMLWLLVNLLSPDSGLFSYLQLRRNLSQHQENLDVLNHDLSMLESQIQWLDEPQYRGMVVRTQWGFIQAGDQQYGLKGDESAA
ncbi:hypothetical protein OAT84_01060 [Gammaproteobacteria bacterium]|nr:hypothetical protein [Gammaproteobacteria bacterium]